MTDPVVDVGPPRTAADLDAVRDLMRAFVAWHHGRHEEDRDLVAAYFDDAAFERELEQLEERYAPPGGGLLVARLDGAPVGCVALRRLDEHTCEMKRMFVRPQAQHRGVGGALGRAVVALAVEAGYTAMVLDTSVRQHEAATLYRRLGFVDVPPYYDLPEPLAAWLVFMRLDLTGSRPAALGQPRAAKTG
jgi:GNAT superfamily N-acetyltransferase